MILEIAEIILALIGAVFVIYWGIQLIAALVILIRWK